MSRLSVNDPVVVTYASGRTKRGRVLGFDPVEEWDAAAKRSYRRHDVIVAFPDGSVSHFRPPAVKSEKSPKVRNG